MIGDNATMYHYRMIYGTSTNTFADTPSQVFDAYVESQNVEVTQALGQGYNVEIYDMFCDGDIVLNLGDKLVDNNGTEYRVTGVEKHTNNDDIEDLLRVKLNKERRKDV